MRPIDWAAVVVIALELLDRVRRWRRVWREDRAVREATKQKVAETEQARVLLDDPRDC